VLCLQGFMAVTATATLLTAYLAIMWTITACRKTAHQGRSASRAFPAPGEAPSNAASPPTTETAQGHGPSIDVERGSSQEPCLKATPTAWAAGEAPAEAQNQPSWQQDGSILVLLVQLLLLC